MKEADNGKEIFYSEKRNFGFLLILSAQAFGAKAYPFSDKLEFFLEMTKVIGATVVMVSVIVAVYFHRAGRNDALGTAIWFVFAGALTFSLEWFAEQVGLVSGILF